VVVAGLAACQTSAGSGGDDGPAIDAPGGSGSGTSATDPFAASTTKIVVEVDYEVGQEPYTGTVITFGESWEPTVTNINRLFAGKKDITIPTTLAEMSNVGNIADEELTIADIAALATSHRDQHGTADTKTYWVIFVGG